MNTQENNLKMSARASALDINQSFLVRAPAGSGKAICVARYSQSLLHIDGNPNVLAITFTIKLQQNEERVLNVLAQTRSEPVPDDTDVLHHLAYQVN